MAHDTTVREYLLPPPNSFWEWREGGEVITWKDGKTIAFRDELRAVLAWLAPHGLPPLDTVALLLSATHDAWSSTGSEVQIIRVIIQQSIYGPSALNEIVKRLGEV